MQLEDGFQASTLMGTAATNVKGVATENSKKKHEKCATLVLKQQNQNFQKSAKNPIKVLLQKAIYEK